MENEKSNKDILTDHLKEIPVKNIAEEFKCKKCGYVGKTDVSLKKHINTRHPHDTVESSSAEINLHEVACVLSCIDDLFQMEIVEGEQLYACNVCDEGFEKSDQIRNHIENNHKEIILQLSKDINNEEGSESDSTCSEESYGDTWLAKFDEDGNFIW